MLTITEIARTVLRNIWDIPDAAFDAMWSVIIKHRADLSTLATRTAHQQNRPLAGSGMRAEDPVIGATLIFEASLQEGAGLVILEKLCQDVIRLGEQAGLKNIGGRITMELKKLPANTIITNEHQQPETPIVATAHRHDQDLPQKLTEADVDALLQRREDFRIFIDHWRNEEFGQVYFEGRPMHLPKSDNDQGERTHLNLTEFRILRYVLMELKSGRTSMPDLVEHCFGADQEEADDLRKKRTKKSTEFHETTATHRDTVGELSTLLHRELGVRLISERKKLYHLVPECSYCVIQRRESQRGGGTSRA
jgi:hypothetical protein